MLPALVAGGTALAGGLLGMYGQQQTNASNEAMAHQTSAVNQAESQRNRVFQAEQSSASMAFEAQQAQNQMTFQERMSSTAKQREAADLRAAGLNPLMAAHGGASSPAGAAGSGSAASGDSASGVTATMQNPLAGMGGIATSALEAMSLAGGLGKQEAETENIRAQTAKAKMDTEVSKRGLPKSELTNDAYDIIRPIVKKLKQGLQYSAPKTKPMKTVPESIWKDMKNFLP